MELVNLTPVPARCFVGYAPDGGRHALLVAKATFRFDRLAPELSADDASPIFESDVETELGILPTDLRPRRADTFEVILLGCARANDGTLCTSRTVGMRVGVHHRELIASGRRTWMRAGPTWKLSDTEPFEALPMTWEHAHGGTAKVQLDATRSIQLFDPLNRRGCGFDPHDIIERLPRDEYTAPGYPQTDYIRGVPRLEHPRELVWRWDDRPEPACWATVPRDIGFSSIRLLRRLRAGVQNLPEHADEVHDRAHPDWMIPVPSASAALELIGMRSAGRWVTTLPQLRVLVDFAVGRGHGTYELAPRMLLLQPEIARMCVVYRKIVTLEAPREGETRSLRLRLEDGWNREVSV